MSEPREDELGEFLAAYRAVDRPTSHARAATWAAIERRLADDPDLATPRSRARLATLAALAAAVALCLGLAAAVARQVRPATSVAASHHTALPAPQTLERSAFDARSDRPDPRPVTPRDAASPDPRDTLLEYPDPTSSDHRDTPLDHPDPTSPDHPDHPNLAPPTSDSLEPSQPRANSRIRPRPASSPALSPEEVASFQRAQAALAEGRDAAALAALDAHGRRFPGGIFEEERLVSRATALCRLGRLADARAARDRFLADRPTSHLAERMRRLCRENE